jgi:hypothetical protein
MNRHKLIVYGRISHNEAVGKVITLTIIEKMMYKKSTPLKTTIEKYAQN